MLQRERIRVGLNATDFLKGILNVGDFTRKFKRNHYFINAGDSRQPLKVIPRSKIL